MVDAPPLPPSMKDGLTVHNLPNGNAEIRIIDGGKVAGRMEVHPASLGAIASALLSCAKNAQDIARKPAPETVRDQTIRAAIHPSKVAIGANQQPNSPDYLIAICGEA